MMVEDYRSWNGHAASFADHPLGPVLGVPLKSGSEVTGIIGITRPPGSPPFHQEELDLMIRFAQLASIALDNARLHTSLQQELAERRRAEAELQKAYQTLERRVSERTRELEILNSIAAAVNRSLNLTEVFQYAIDTTGDALGLEVGAAFRLDEEAAQDSDPRLTLLAHRGLSAEFLPFVEHLPLRGSMIEETASGRADRWPGSPPSTASSRFGRPWCRRGSPSGSACRSWPREGCSGPWCSARAGSAP